MLAASDAWASLAVRDGHATLSVREGALALRRLAATDVGDGDLGGARCLSAGVELRV